MFEPHRRHCVVSLSRNISLVLVQPRKTRPFKTDILFMGCKESNQTNKTRKENSTLCLLGNLLLLECRQLIQNQSFQKILSEIPSVSNSLVQDQARCIIGPDLGSNCLQKLSADNKKCSGSMVECLTQDGGAVGLSLTSVTALCP